MYGNACWAVSSSDHHTGWHERGGSHMFWLFLFIGVVALAGLYVWLDLRAKPRWRRARDSGDPGVWTEHQRRGPGIGGQNW
jgi:hypothetical protein